MKMQRSFLTTLSLFLLWELDAILADGENALSPSQALNYLRKFGHARAPDHMSGGLMSLESLEDSISSFQRFAGLEITGELNEPTLQKMTAKRCGNPDIAGTDNNKRKRRYALQGSKWPKKDLIYKITKYTPDLTQSETDRSIRDAFRWWSDVSDLTFSQVPASSKADIEIVFAGGYHGDGDPFDGQGQTLAHAYFPTFGGDAHFDEAERWLLQSSRTGVSLKIVAAHEFGHSLGLSHSDVQQALMAPFYNPLSDGLHTDDIAAIQRLYGSPYEKPNVIPTNRPTTTRRTTTRRTTTRRPVTTKRPPTGSCDGRFDAITTLTNGSTYAFVGGWFWKLNNQGAERGYPLPTENVWKGIRGKVDAALAHGIYTDIFQGDKVYRFFAGRLQVGYPRQIKALYRGIPSHIDAAFQWSGNNKFYFMKGEQYWRYNSATTQADPGYPRSLSVWKGLPTKVDAALQWNGKTYFFRDGMYYRFDDEEIKVAELTQQPYPRRADEWWLGCRDNTLSEAISLGDGQGATGEEERDDGGNGGGSKVNSSQSMFLVVATLTLGAMNLFLA